MKLTIKIVHLIALACFLGSIITYITLSTFINEQNTNEILLNREWILQSTKFLTIPALLILIFTGIILTSFSRQKWHIFKIVGAVIILINTFFMILPAIENSLFQIEKDIEKFQLAMQQEAIFGAINLIFILLLIIISVKNTTKRK